jgi:membrane peptidoglycan carboxypeptidase
LGRGFTSLQKLTDAYLRLLADQGVISRALADAALQEQVKVLPKASALVADKVALNKTPLVMRSRLANLLNIRSNYELDRLDLTVKSTLDNAVQQAVMDALKKLSQADQVNAAGLVGSHLLTNVKHLDAVTYSLMLYERTPVGNLLRVQTDNYEQALDINEGIRLDLGSTSKLRTLVHYLELIADIYKQYHDYTQKDLAQLALHPRDHLSLWVVEQLQTHPTINLANLLTLAIDKTYSASPGESFFTGGGLHSFANFNKADNYKVLSVRHALRDSVNLVFIRLMRDVVYHHLYKPEGIARWLESPDDPRREEYLARFADREGSVYLRKFFAKYHGMTTEQALSSLTQRVYANPARLTMLYRAIYPNHDETALADYLKAHVETPLWEGEKISTLFNKYSINHFDLQDQGYLTKLHPLELWLVNYLATHPSASQNEVLEAGQQARQQVYRWLTKSRKHHAQQQRIMVLLEMEAFWKIHVHL